MDTNIRAINALNLKTVIRTISNTIAATSTIKSMVSRVLSRLIVVQNWRFLKSGYPALQQTQM
jgi:hypothetical protein